MIINKDNIKNYITNHGKILIISDNIDKIDDVPDTVFIINHIGSNQIPYISGRKQVKRYIELLNNKYLLSQFLLD